MSKSISQVAGLFFSTAAAALTLTLVSSAPARADAWSDKRQEAIDELRENQQQLQDARQRGDWNRVAQEEFEVSASQNKLAFYSQPPNGSVPNGNYANVGMPNYGPVYNNAPGYGPYVNNGPGYGPYVNSGPGYGPYVNNGPGSSPYVNNGPGYGPYVNNGPGYNSAGYAPYNNGRSYDSGEARDHRSDYNRVNPWAGPGFNVNYQR